MYIYFFLKKKKKKKKKKKNKNKKYDSSFKKISLNINLIINISKN